MFVTKLQPNKDEKHIIDNMVCAGGLQIED